MSACFIMEIAPPVNPSLLTNMYTLSSIIKNLNSSNKSGTRIPNVSESEKSKSHKTFETTFTLEQVFGFVKASGFLVLQIKRVYTAQLDTAIFSTNEAMLLWQCIAMNLKNIRLCKCTQILYEKRSHETFFWIQIFSDTCTRFPQTFRDFEVPDLYLICDNFVSDLCSLV